MLVLEKGKDSVLTLCMALLGLSTIRWTSRVFVCKLTRIISSVSMRANEAAYVRSGAVRIWDSESAHGSQRVRGKILRARLSLFSNQPGTDSRVEPSPGRSSRRCCRPQLPCVRNTHHERSLHFLQTAAVYLEWLREDGQSLY